MGNEKTKKKKKKEEPKVVVVEFRVSMHCNACERTVARTISKIKGLSLSSFSLFCNKNLKMGLVDLRTFVLHETCRSDVVTMENGRFFMCACFTINVGVETFSTDMNQHKVVVTGRIDPKKVLKKLKKKTGKKVEILENKEDRANEEGANDDGEGKEGSKAMVAEEQNVIIHPSMLGYCCVENEVLMMFSDENPNACSIM
ncbi:heavy metal-associated isoprenylated plant protein 19 isoform X1 [Rhodamnia argentea]|uniref:Heavy metal-associated isoprenylated plant protein 19 isoform X1 n=1 Tax=Rhodamnia argentea TaxID=178133 RepID=A0ABM3GZE3_9MYRT|nr:heavy metal-associated isoprenylated plant protein 19 isoform X1 [Rhodamnia argentea]